MDRSILYALELERFGCASVTLKDEQTACVKAIYEGKDVFLWLPTGFVCVCVCVCVRLKNWTVFMANFPIILVTNIHFVILPIADTNIFGRYQYFWPI